MSDASICGLRRRISVATVLLVAGASCTQPVGPTAPVVVTRNIVLTSAALIPESEGATVTVTARTANIVYPNVPLDPPAVGRVIVGSQNGGYLVRLTAVTPRSDRAFDAAITPAEISDVIADGAFDLTLGADAPAWQPGVAIAPLDSSLLEVVSGLFAGTDAPCSLSAAQLVALRPTVQTNPRIDAHIDVSPSHTVTGAINVSGSIDIDAAITLEAGQRAIQCRGDLVAWLRAHGHSVPAFQWNGVAAAGPVPLAWEVTVEPLFDWRVTVDASLGHLVLHATARTTYYAGLVRSPGDPGWSAQLNPPRLDPGSPTIELTEARGPRARATASVGLGARATLSLWHLVTPSAELRLRLNGTGEVNACGWTLDGDAALEFRADLRVGPNIQYLHHDFALTPQPIVLWRTGEGSIASLSAHRSFGVCEPASTCFAQTACGACIGAPACVYCPTDGCVPETVGTLCASPPRLTSAQCAECNPLGATCVVNLDCCGASSNPAISCVDQRCVDTTTCLPRGAACTTEPCCSASSVCGSIAADSSGAGHCCQIAGTACALDSDCCGSMRCGAGHCVAHVAGEPCSTLWECGSGLGCIAGICAYGP